jgi:hypothetical protein
MGTGDTNQPPVQVVGSIPTNYHILNFTLNRFKHGAVTVLQCR